jgi:hypothetical protein
MSSAMSGRGFFEPHYLFVGGGVQDPHLPRPSVVPPSPIAWERGFQLAIPKANSPLSRIAGEEGPIAQRWEVRGFWLSRAR